jgi:DNA repair exonuclease SbcCD ATPase subunit
VFELQADQYQILDDVDITVDGLTFLVGSADNGKSSVMRALHGALYNQTGDDFIQQGKDEAEVTLDFGDLEIEWNPQRGKGSDYYVNGEHFDKIGRGYFDELLQHGFRPIQAGPDEFKLQFWMQMAPFLICNRPDTRKFEILANIFESDKFADVLDNMKSDRKELRNDIEKKQTQVDVKQDDLQLAKDKRSVYVEFFGNYSDQMDEIRDKHDRLEQLGELKESYNTVKNKLDTVEQQIERYESVLESIPDSDDISRRVNVAQSIDRYLELTDFIDSVNTVSGLFDGVGTDRLEKLYTMIETIGEYRDKKQFIDSFSDIDFDVEFDMDGVKQTIEQARKANQFMELAEECASKEHRISEKANELESVRSKINDVKDELEVCPTCNQPFGDGHNE